jgi:hypothetical protein
MAAFSIAVPQPGRQYGQLPVAPVPTITVHAATVGGGADRQVARISVVAMLIDVHTYAGEEPAWRCSATGGS